MHSSLAVAEEVARFNPELELAEATPPPASWYLSADFLSLEKQTVFRNHWLFVGHVEQVAQNGSFFSGNLMGRPYLVSRDGEGILRAFYNVCAHHGTRVVKGCGHAEKFTCPYHGWEYDMKGSLRKAPLAGSIAKLRERAPGLKEIPLETWGPFILLNFGDAPDLETHFGTLMAELPGLRWEKLTHVAQRTYTMDCNWKVFVDNYLDGGYHVAHMHPALADGLELKSYRSRCGELFSVQNCPAKGSQDRLGEDAIYLWVHPNFMINRYGTWMDTNLVIPRGPERCEVIFDYFHEGPVTDTALSQALKDSDQVQKEDMEVVGMVQEGLGSGVYSGLYAPRFEAPMYLFHQLLHRDYRAGL